MVCEIIAKQTETLSSSIMLQDDFKRLVEDDLLPHYQGQYAGGNMQYVLTALFFHSAALADNFAYLNTPLFLNQVLWGGKVAWWCSGIMVMWQDVYMIIG